MDRNIYLVEVTQLDKVRTWSKFIAKGAVRNLTNGRWRPWDENNLLVVRLEPIACKLFVNVCIARSNESCTQGAERIRNYGLPEIQLSR